MDGSQRKKEKKELKPYGCGSVKVMNSKQRGVSFLLNVTANTSGVMQEQVPIR